MNAHLQPDPNVVFTQISEDQTALLHLITKQYYTLNETGARIWHLLQEGGSPATIAAALELEYGIDGEHALQSVQRFLDGMVAARLVEEVAS